LAGRHFPGTLKTQILPAGIALHCTALHRIYSAFFCNALFLGFGKKHELFLDAKLTPSFGVCRVHWIGTISSHDVLVINAAGMKKEGLLMLMPLCSADNLQRSVRPREHLVLLRHIVSGFHFYARAYDLSFFHE